MKNDLFLLHPPTKVPGLDNNWHVVDQICTSTMQTDITTYAKVEGATPDEQRALYRATKPVIVSA